MRIGLLIEGGIDEEILRPLIQQLLAGLPKHRRRGVDYYPVLFPPNGYGEIPKNLKMLTRLYQDETERRRVGCDLFLVVLDSKKTDAVQKEIKDILRSSPDFPALYGLAIQEMEAWILGDMDHVNKHVFKINPAPVLPEAPELDPDPKRTLINLYIRPSTVIDYDSWNCDCARLVAPHLRSSQIAFKCPKGFGKVKQNFIRKCKKY